MIRDAVLSSCRRYRYALWRSWDEGAARSGYVLFIGLNPSTADERIDDPTIRRCVGFAKSWGFGKLCMANLFAWRATSPAQMKVAHDPIGPDNERLLDRMAADAALVIAAWGADGCFMQRGTEVASRLSRLHCLRQTKDGSPAHPLYLPKHLQPVPFPGDRREITASE